MKNIWLTKSVLAFVALCFTHAEANDQDNFLIDCEGINCFFQVMTIMAYRLPWNMVALTDHISGRFSERDRLRLELSQEKFSVEAAKHDARMETDRLTLELRNILIEKEKAKLKKLLSKDKDEKTLGDGRFVLYVKK